VSWTVVPRASIKGDLDRGPANHGRAFGPMPGMKELDIAAPRTARSG
jgi:hypothetical protein